MSGRTSSSAERSPFRRLFAALYGRLSGATLVIHSDGTSQSERGLNQLQLAARKILVREVAVCVGNSEPAVERFVELGVAPDRVFRAPHTTNIAPLHAVARSRDPSRPRPRPPAVLHVGRLIPRKGVDRLLRAFANARERVALRLILVGSGPQEPRLRELAADLGLGTDVEFRGFVDQPELAAVYAEADVFAFPTLDDPFGIVVLGSRGGWAARGRLAVRWGDARPDRRWAQRLRGRSERYRRLGARAYQAGRGSELASAARVPRPSSDADANTGTRRGRVCRSCTFGASAKGGRAI